MRRPSACCRAVQRQVLPRSDSVWVSDEILLSVFQRFSVTSRCPRRQGSSVPGPLESRRKLGKRRMTHVSEASPTASYDPGFWGLSGDVDRSQLQWKPPTRRPLKETPCRTPLPTWLTDEHAMRLEAASIEEMALFSRDARYFRERLKRATSVEVPKICYEFNQSCKRSLTLGLASGNNITAALRSISEDLRKSAVSSECAAPLCLTFYKALWEGIMASKVLRSVDLGTNVMKELVAHIAQLPMTREVQTFAHDVLLSLSGTQLRTINKEIGILVMAWMRSWHQEQLFGDCSPSLSAADCSITNAEGRVLYAHQLAMAMGERLNSRETLIEVEAAISDARLGISLGLDAIIEVENAMSPMRLSVETLADTLENLPHELVLQLLNSTSLRMFFMRPIGLGCSKYSAYTFRFCFLSMMAKMRSVDDKLLVSIWREVDPPKTSRISWSDATKVDALTEHESSGLVLSHWISQGCVTDVAAVRNNFAIEPSIGKWDFGLLVHTMAQHRQEYEKLALHLFILLCKLGRYNAIHEALSRMLDLGTEVPVSLIGQTIDLVSNYSPRTALNIYNLHITMPFDKKSLQLDEYPNFIIAMINDPGITPKTIWSTLRIPLYEELPSSRRVMCSSERLPQSMIDLIHEMALAFAHQESRPVRVSLRNVMQCAHYLRMHRVPVMPALTRAIGHAGITRDIIREHWVGTERLRWALNLIAWVEGKDVTDRIDNAVYQWRWHLTQKQRRWKRESNVLGIGPID